MLTKVKMKVAVLLVVGAVIVTRGSGAAVEYSPLGRKQAVAQPMLVAVEKNGLSLNIAPTKRTFAADERPAYRVVWRNTSDKPFMLYDSDFYRAIGVWKISARNLDTGENFLLLQSIKCILRAATESRRLEPGAEFAFDLVISDDHHLPRGRYEFTFAVTLRANSARQYDVTHWTGEIVSAPIAVTVQPPQDFSMTAVPAKNRFAVNEPLAFRVSWKNSNPSYSRNLIRFIRPLFTRKLSAQLRVHQRTTCELFGVLRLLTNPFKQSLDFFRRRFVI